MSKKKTAQRIQEREEKMNKKRQAILKNINVDNSFMHREFLIPVVSQKISVELHKGKCKFDSQPFTLFLIDGGKAKEGNSGKLAVQHVFKNETDIEICKRIVNEKIHKKINRGYYGKFAIKHDSLQEKFRRLNVDSETQQKIINKGIEEAIRTCLKPCVHV